ncbi:MAG: DUF2478 domain-containing protein [Tabrizicola sp.]|uniref:DUF2478 domain-containing protein n=1 Tax=Tabrizicola sp. TaxID=2005166 RepID=UPI002735E218|nr:DUF2478 domain-containing protein [Tabrizicola sp.]MDP3264194.1 DUF2478 domain-containing protein [Tabrizicola sp.]
MRIGYVSLQGRGATDACIAAVVAELQGAGARLAGTVQTNLDRAKDHPCDMDLMVLPAGPIHRISQDLGPGARGCRLNGGVLEEAVMQAALHLAGADLLVVNKYGKLEAEGRGFVPLIAEALERGTPVLVGVNGLNLPAFLHFSAGTARHLTCTSAEIARWLSGQPAF